MALETIFPGQAGEDVKEAAKYAEGIDAFGSEVDLDIINRPCAWDAPRRGR